MGGGAYRNFTAQAGDAPPPSGHEARSLADWKPKPLGPGGGGYDPDKRANRAASRGTPRRKKAG